MQTNDNDESMRVPLDERFEIEAAIRAYVRLGYVGEDVLEQMTTMFRFNLEEARAILKAA